MNGFTRKCLKLSIITFIIGSILTCVGLVGGATGYPEDMNIDDEKYEYYDSQTTTPINNASSSTSVSTNDMAANVSLADENNKPTVDSSNVNSGSMNVTYSEDNIENLDFNFAVSAVQIVVGDQFSINASNVDSKFNSYVKNDTWYISDEGMKIDFNLFSGNSSKNKHDIISDILITIPDGQFFNNVEINVAAGTISMAQIISDNTTLDISAGSLEVTEIQTEDLELSCGAGTAAIYNGNVSNMDMECGMGSIQFIGNIQGDGDIECGMGNITMNLDTEKQFYNYDINCGMGKVNIYGDVYSGLSSEKEIDNNAEFDLNIDCGMGSITINS